MPRSRANQQKIKAAGFPTALSVYTESILFRYKRQKGNGSGSLDSAGNLALVMSTIACYPAGQDLALLGDVPAQPGHIFVIDKLYFVGAKITLPPFTFAFLFQFETSLKRYFVVFHHIYVANFNFPSQCFPSIAIMRFLAVVGCG